VSKLYKFGFLNPEDQPYHYPNVWATEQTSGPSRLMIAPRGNQVDLLLRLIEAMPESFLVLYVLVVPRGGSEAGRYESSELQTRDSVRQFLQEFKDFFENDGRHHLWIHSVSNSGTLVFDRHNLIYGYGPLNDLETILSEIGLEKSLSIQIPDPHAHHYNESLDREEHRVLAYWPWLSTPLLDADIA
jgi:hypothetical protein